MDATAHHRHDISDELWTYPFSHMPTEPREKPLMGNSQQLALLQNHVVKQFYPTKPVGK